MTRLRWCVEQERSPMARWHLLVGRGRARAGPWRLTAALDLGDEALG